MRCCSRRSFRRKLRRRKEQSVRLSRRRRRDQTRIKAAVELMFKIKVKGCRSSTSGARTSASGASKGAAATGKRPTCRCCRDPTARSRKSPSRFRSNPCLSSKSNLPRPAGAPSSSWSTPTCTRAGRTRPWSRSSRRKPAATPTATSRCATRAAATSSTTVSSIFAATRTAFRPRSSGWNTIRIAVRTWPCCATPTASAVTSSRPRA